MEEKKTTRFGELTSLFFKQANNIPLDQPEQGKELLNSTSQTDLHARALEIQQQEYLHRQWMSINNSNKDKVLMYEANRLQQYIDYQGMEYYPTISAALDVLAEESTTVGQDGRMLTITSNNHKVKKELENLFYNRLNVNTTLQFWARNLCKYGDNFLYLILDPKLGVTSSKQLSIIDVERVEEESDGHLKVFFKYKNQREGLQEFAVWQIAHFRLLGDDRRMPYGMSVLDKVRRTWKMLTLVEDAMMVYRITRAAERRVFKIDVGNLPTEDIEAYVKVVASGIKKAKLTDHNTGDFNWKYNVATADSDYFIPVRSANATNPIDTLPGAGNLSDIDDIKYLRDNLYTGLGIPASFLAFSAESSPGEGKSLSMLDIRFSRKINKIQQALISELNKIAIIHLSLLGGDYAEHIDNFTLSLANPSTQAELLKMETLSQKLDVYAKAVAPTETGIKPMSESRAKKMILNMSDEEIQDDLLDQMIESKIGDEIKTSPRLIKSSKMFDRAIKWFNAGFFSKPEEGENTGMEDQMGGDMPGTDLGGMPGGDMGGMPGGDMSGIPGSDLGGMPGGQDPLAGLNENKKLINEGLKINKQLEELLKKYN